MNKLDLTLRIRSLVMRTKDFLADVLCPQWRIMFIITGTFFLYEAIVSVDPGQGKLLWSQGFVSILYSCLSMTALWIASRVTMPRWVATTWERIPLWLHWRGWRGMLTIGILLIAYRSISGQIPDAIRGKYHNDAIAFIHLDADILLKGQNPYTDNNAFWSASFRWPQAFATPLFDSTAFGSDPLLYPSAKKLGRILHDQTVNVTHRNNDFDPATVHNYPAGIIWLVLPFVWAGSHSVVWLNIILMIALIALIVSRAPPSTKIPLAVALLANSAFILYGLFVNFDIAAVVCVVAAWHWHDRLKVSSLLIGFACAVKQLAWFIAPFYLLDVLRREGWRKALERSVWIGVGFLVPNLPFIIASPRAWLHSILIPMTDPLFPLGFGPIALALGRVIPFGTPKDWTLLVLTVFALLLIYQWRRKDITADAMVLAIIPLWFSWRSPMNYFALIPAMVAWIVVQRMVAEQKQPQVQVAPEVHMEQPLETINLHQKEYSNKFATKKPSTAAKSEKSLLPIGKER